MMQIGSQQKAVPKVAIIGAGISGILSARHLQDTCDVKVFEARDTFGGLWNYTPENESNWSTLNKNAYYQLYGWLGASQYSGLRTIVPKLLMTFKDFDFDESLPDELTAKQYYDYVAQYIETFKLEKNFQYNSTVVSVKPVEDPKSRIMVKSVSTDLTDKAEAVEYFDYAVVCNGHFSVPNQPRFKGWEDYDGVSFHMHELRDLQPELFDGKAVLIVGVNMSALDLVTMLLLRENSEIVPSKVFITAKNVTKMETWQDFRVLREEGRLIVKRGNVAEMAHGKTVIFGDGSRETIDTVVYCTGYKFSFPFLDPSDSILDVDQEVEYDGYFGPLYKKIFSARDPRFMFPGTINCHFLANAVIEKQVMICAQFINGQISLPSSEEMEEEINTEREDVESHNATYYCLYGYNSQYSYLEDLASLSCLEEDKRYYDFKPVDELFFKIIGKGNVIETRSLDYKKLFKDIAFSPISSLF